MDKYSLTQAVAEATKMTRKSASLTIDAIFDTITQSLKAGDPVTLVGFGSFKTKKEQPVQAVTPVQGKLSRSLQQQYLPSAPVNS